MRSIGVAVAHPDPGVVDELVHALEAAPDLYLALDESKASVLVAGAAAMRARSSEPSVAGRAMVGLAVDGDLAEVARVALGCRADGLVAWPADREGLRVAIREAASRARLSVAGSDGKLIAVAGARGGTGASTVAGMLTAALDGAVVVDLDPGGGGQSAFVPPDTDATLDTVLDVVDELDPAGLRSAFSKHAAGSALCASRRRAPAAREQIERLMLLLRATVPHAVADLGRASDAGCRAAIREADLLLCVCAPDLQSMRGARRLAESTPGIRFVLNSSTRMRLSPRDVARVLGSPPLEVIPLDPAIRKAGEAGRFPTRGPGRRAANRLAATIKKELADGR